MSLLFKSGLETRSYHSNTISYCVNKDSLWPGVLSGNRQDLK